MLTHLFSSLPQDAKRACQAHHANLLPSAIPSTQHAPSTAGLSLPSARLLAKVLRSVAAVELQLARECEVHAEEDRSKARPEFPTVSGQDDRAITDFIDAMASADQASLG